MHELGGLNCKTAALWNNRQIADLEKKRRGPNLGQAHQQGRKKTTGGRWGGAHPWAVAHLQRSRLGAPGPGKLGRPTKEEEAGRTRPAGAGPKAGPAKGQRSQGGSGWIGLLPIRGGGGAGELRREGWMARGRRDGRERTDPGTGTLDLAVVVDDRAPGGGFRRGGALMAAYLDGARQGARWCGGEASAVRRCLSGEVR